jgi:hypothetical protein
MAIQKKQRASQGGCAVVGLIFLVMLFSLPDSEERPKVAQPDPPKQEGDKTDVPDKITQAQESTNQNLSRKTKVKKNTDPPIQSPPFIEPKPETIPADVTYKVIGREIIPGKKRGVDILINRRVSKKVLHLIALEVKNADSNSYDRTFIGYYLPGMKVNSGYWATTHSNPTLEVKILGTTIEEEAATLPQKQEKAAESKLRLAEQFLAQGKKAAAKEWLEKVVRDYPNTSAAKQAAKLVKNLDKRP